MINKQGDLQGSSQDTQQSNGKNQKRTTKTRELIYKGTRLINTR